MTILNVVVNRDTGDCSIGWLASRPDSSKIEEWLQRLSPGYVEYILRFTVDPHCNACRDDDCELQGTGNDACPGFKFGERW